MLIVHPAQEHSPGLLCQWMLAKNYMLPSFSSIYLMLTLMFTLLSFPEVFVFALLWMRLGWGGGGLALIRSLKHVTLSCLFFFFFPSSYEPSLATFLPNWTCRFWTFIPNKNIWFPLIHGFFSSFLNMTLMLWAVFGNNKNIIEINLFNSTSHRHHVCTRWYSACDINVE